MAIDKACNFYGFFISEAPGQGRRFLKQRAGRDIMGFVVKMADLLKNPVLGRLTASPAYPLAAQIFTLICFGLLIAGGLAAPHVPASLTGTMRNTNLAALVAWSLWWPLVIIAAVLAGRVWCQVCPMELVNSLSSRIGLKRKVPRFIASGWGSGLFYALVLLGFIRTFQAHRYPERMAIFFIFLLGSAVVAGLVFEKRAFCNHLCPVGRLLGLYACSAPLEWRVRDEKTCRDCRTKDCIDPGKVYRLTGRSCSSGLYPATLKDNRDCLVCTQCRKVCPSDNLRWSLRRPMSDLFAGFRLRSVELFLLVLVSGLVVWELGEEWKPVEKALGSVPAALNSRLGFSGEAANLVQALCLFVVLPAGLYLIPGLMGKWLNRTSLLDSAKAFGAVFLPVVAVGHLVKAVIRITSRLPYYPLAFNDPVGYATANQILAGDVTVDMGMAKAVFPWVSWAALILMGAAVLSVGLIGWRAASRPSAERPGRISHLAVAAVYGAFLVFVVFKARF